MCVKPGSLQIWRTSHTSLVLSLSLFSLSRLHILHHAIQTGWVNQIQKVTTGDRQVGRQDTENSLYFANVRQCLKYYSLFYQTEKKNVENKYIFSLKYPSNNNEQQSIFKRAGKGRHVFIIFIFTAESCQTCLLDYLMFR